MPGEAQRVIEEFWATRSGGDCARLVDLFAEDARLEDPIFGTHCGSEEIRAFMVKMVEQLSPAGISFTLDEVCGDDHTVWSRWTMHSANGSRGGCGIYKVRDGHLTYYRDYVDPVEPSLSESDE